MRLRFDIAYRGLYFHGWAKQDGLTTVQGTLEEALALVCRERIDLTVAGRTDAGVHALGQVAHADIPDPFWMALLPRGKGAQSFSPAQAISQPADAAILSNTASVHPPAAPPAAAPAAAPAAPPAAALPVLNSAPPALNSNPLDTWRCSNLLRRLNKLIGRKTDGAVVIKNIQTISEDFDARFSALWREYCYRISDCGWVDPTRLNVAASTHPLDTESMHCAAQAFVGEHDFLPFAKPREGATTIRTLHSFHVKRNDEGLIEARIRADAFCHSQVRFMMGALMRIGAGLENVGWIAKLLEAGVKTGTVPLAPGAGLTLEKVGYPSAEEYAQQSRRARVLRTHLGMADSTEERP